MKEGKDTYHVTYAGSYLRRKQTAEVLAYWLYSNGFRTLLLRWNHDNTLPLQFKDPVKWRFSLWKTDLCAPNYRRVETHEGPGLRASAAWSLLDGFQQEYMCSACTGGFFSPCFLFKNQHERLNASWEADVISLPRCTQDTCPPLCFCSQSYMVLTIRYFRLEQNASPLPHVLLCFLSLSSHLPGPPSAPRNVISSINETSVILDWSWPEDSGGRRDVTFTVVCKRCRGMAGTSGGGGNQRCEPCRSNVRFLPRAEGLQNTTVTVADLLAHTNYTFEIEAQNGVSPLAPTMRQYAAVTITTNQAGEMPQQTSRWIKACAQIIRQELT